MLVVVSNVTDALPILPTPMAKLTGVSLTAFIGVSVSEKVSTFGAGVGVVVGVSVGVAVGVSVVVEVSVKVGVSVSGS